MAIPLSTIDWNLKRGFDIPIEERHEHEVLGAWGVLSSPEAGNPESRNQTSAFMCAWPIPASPARNPGFDVTPAELITGIITPAGIFKPEALWDQRDKLGFVD